MTPTLQRQTGKAMALEELVGAARSALARDEQAIALIYTPRLCTFAVLKADGLVGPPDTPLGTGAAFANASIAEAYEMRLFHRDWEARWLRHGRTGRAALQWETGAPPLGGLGGLSSTPVLGVIDQQYLLWGEPAKTTDTGNGERWAKLTSARIGTLWAPLSAPPAGGRPRAILRTREYLATEKGWHGNVAVIEERLVDLAWYQG